ncbi:glutamate-rich protein 3 [Scomber scombrus]|uniref:glutamate-rich protein 3 n=1 Tax=Scomber scombrus TaxID=13677 RepID=UPI002DD8927C|nr:glutamate-rich protein 3 [Scomber scombrus]
MSHFNPGLISAYNSLTDKHLAGYFSNTRIRRHLQRAGLITRSGRIVPDKEYRHKLIQRSHQRHVRECLAQAIFHKVLEMERLHQIEIKRKLEEFARRERVHKIKVERSKRYEEEIIHILSPRPPTGARGVRKQHSGPEGEHSESSESPSSSRPNTAPGKMQRPVRLKPIHSNNNTASLRRSSPYRLHESSNENDQPFNCTMDKESHRRLTTMDTSRGISPYCLPVINNFVTPVPPTTKRKERGVKVTPSGTVRGRRLRPTTASSGVDVHEEPPMLRSSVHQSRVCVNMVYFGKTVHLSHDLSDMRDEIKVFQQHCGGENLCVYKGKLREGEMFGFISRRHRGFPFSLTFFLNGLQVERLSSCCEFKHRKGSRLGGRHGHFGFSGVEGASPCYKCIIAMGLDKKPTPPPKKVKDDGVKEETVASPKDTAEMETEKTVEDAGSHSECETSQPQDMETQVKKETAPEEDKLRDDYEEDFEADDEGPTEDTEIKEKKSPSPPRETEKQAQQRDASETEDDEKDEDEKSHSGSSCSGSDREESDTEAPKDSIENEIVEQTTEVDHEETAAPSDEKDELNPEEAAAESAAAKDSDIQDSAGDSTEIEISDASVPSGTENKQDDETSGDKEDEKTSDKSKQEEEQERAKSVQEKLAEAILKESQCSSEPELSDTSTEEEEEEEATDKGHKQDNEDAVPEKNVVVEAEVVLVQEETSEPKEQKDESEQEAHESNESSQDELVKKDEDVEKVASEGDKDEAAVEKDESGVMENADASLQPVSEEKMAEDDKTSESQEDAAAKSTEAADKDEENEQKTAEEAETRPDETGNGAKSSGEDESSVSDLNKKTDETEVPDNAEAEAMTANKTMEMKAEPSEEREALSCEEAPVTNTETHQEDSEDRTAGSETEVTADNSSSSSEGSGDTTVHAEKAAETSEDNAKDESNKDEVKEEEAEEADEDDSKKQVCDAGEETEKSVEINDKVEEEKSEEESKEEEKETNPDEIPDSNEEQAEKTLSEEDKVANEEKADKSEKTENNEDNSNLVDSESVKREDGGGESEGKAVAADKTNKGEEINETNADADEEKGDGAEEKEKDENDNEAEESEVVNKDEEEKKITDKSAVAEEISEITEEPEKSLHEDLEKDNVKISDENIVKSEDVGEGEAANANGTKTTEETLNNVTEAENVEEEALKESENGERREVDAENGEKSTGAESKINEDGTETLTEEKNDVNAPEQVEEDRKTEELVESENKDEEKVTVESGDGAGKHEDNTVDQAPAADTVESEADEGEASAGNQSESNKKDSEPEISGTEIKEETKSDNLSTDRKNSKTEEMKEDPDDKDSDTKKDNNQNQVSEVIVASSEDQAQSSTPIDSHGTDHKENEQSDLNTDKHTDENAAADGENGRADTEEASKASEEGASVLLKPEAQSTEVAHNDAEESTAIGTETPEALAKEDNTDLVTNWVTMHQTSKYFETFVEPLEDLGDSAAQTTNSNTEETQSTELTRSVSPLKTVRTSNGKAADGVENGEEGHVQKDVSEAGGENEVEVVQLDLQNNESENNEPLDKEPGKDTLQVEETEVKNLTPNTETEPNDQDSGTELTREDMRSEEHKGSRGSLVEDKIQEGPAEGNIEETDISKTEVESIAGTNHSGISGNLESVTEAQTEEKMTENQPDLHEKQTEEKKDSLSLPKTEEHPQRSEIPELVSTDTKADAQKSSEETQEKTDEDSREVTEITDFTTAKSDDESQEEIQPKPSDGSINGDRRDTQLIQDIKHSLSKDGLSMFSVDETLFGRSSYPLLTTARTESGL